MPLYDATGFRPQAANLMGADGQSTPSFYRPQAANLMPDGYASPNAELERERLYGNPVERGLGQAVRGMKGSAKDFVAGTLDALGQAEVAKSWWDSGKVDQRNAAYVAPEVQRLEQIHDLDTAAKWALGAVGQGAAYVPAAMGAAAAGRVGLGKVMNPTTAAHVGGAALMLPTEAGQAAREMHDDPAAAKMSAGEKFLRSTGVGAVNAALEVLPEAGMVNHVAKRVPVTSLKQAALNAGKEALTNTGKEALTEGLQDTTGQLNNLSYDSNKKYDVMQTVNAAAQGGVGAAPMVGGHAAVTQGLDLLAGTGKLGSDAVQAGGKKISDTAMSAPSTGLGDAWHSYREHPELAQLMSEQTLPPELAKGSDQDVLNWAAGDDNKRRDAALVIAQRTLTNPAASEQAKAEAQGLLNNPGDPEAWRPFAGALVLQEKSRRVGANIREAAEQLGAKIPSIPGGLDAETVANKAGLGVRAAAQTVKAAADGLSKKNLEPTIQDLNYAQLMAPRMEKAFGGQLSPDVSMAAASVLKDYVLGGFGTDEHGNVTVPHGLTAAFGAETPAVVEHAFDLLRRQGRVDEALAAKLADVKTAVEERLPKYKRATQVVWDNLVPEQMEAVPSEDYPHIADSVRRYLDSGKKDPAAEKYLDTLFGPNKSKVLEQIDLLHERGQLKAKHYGEGVDEAGVQESDNAVEEDHDAPIGERGPSYDYHFGSKAGTPFDMEQGHTPEHMMRVSSGLDASRYATRYDKSTGKDYVHAEPVGIVDYARQTGDGAALQKLYSEHAAEREQIGDDALDRKLNSRYKVLRAQELTDDGHDPIDIRVSELKRPATIKGAPNKRAWSDVTAIGTKDVSTIEHGRVFLKQKDGGEFVTSAQKLIGKMWEAKKNGAFEGRTAEQTGGRDMLNMFSAGLSSLLATGQFEGMEVRMPDGSVQLVDKIDDLPKNFVLFTKPGGEKVRISDVLREGAGASTSGTPASAKFETSDIPNMTRSELARALNSLAGGRLLDKGSSPNYDRFVEEAVAFIERTKASASKVESDGKDGGRLRGVAAKAERMLDAFESRVENRPPRDTGRETASGREIGIVGRETMKEAETGETIDVGHKIASDTHVVGEMEEFAAQSKGVERTFDELTGLELHPKESRLDQRKARIEQLRRDYKQANDRLKELVAQRDQQAGTIENLSKYRPDDVVWAAVTPREETEDGHAVAVFKDFGQAQRYAEQRGLNTVQDLAMNLTPPPARKNVPLERSIAEAKRKRDALVEEGKRISAEYKAAADKAEPKRKFNSEPTHKSVTDNPRFAAWFGDSKMKTKDGQPAVLYHSTDNTFDEFDTRMAGRNTDHVSTGLGIFLNPSKERSKVYGQHSMALYVRMENPYKMGVEEFSGFKDQAQAAARQAELRAQGYDGIFVPADKTTIVFDPTQLKSIDNNGNFGIFDANIKRSVVPGDATASFATPEQIKEVRDYVTKTLGPQMHTEWVKSFPHGGSGEWQQGVIRLATSALNPLSVAHHESMHELFSRLTSAKRDKAAQTLLQAANSPLTVRRLERFFADEKYAAVREAIKNDPEERLAYMYQLWASGKMKFGPETQTVFQKVADFLRKITGMLTNDQRAEMIMQAFHDGKMAEPNAMAEALNDIESRGQTLRSIGKTMQPFARRALELTATAESNLAASSNPAVREIQKMFSNRTGSADKDQGFLQAHVQANNQWLNKMGAALRASEGVEKADIEAALEGLQKGERSNDPVIGKIQAGVRKVLDEMHDYLREADVRRFDSESKQWAPIERVRDYFPRSWDTSKLMAEGDKFVAALMTHHADALTAIAVQANKERAAGGEAGKYTASWEKAQKGDATAVTPEDVARAIHQRLLNSDGQADLGEQTNSLGYTPMMKAVNQRTLSWIDMKHFADFQRKDMVQTLTTYVNQATKRAEYARLFGGDGAKLETKMTEAWHHEIDNLAKEQYGVDKASAMAAQAARSPDEWQDHLHTVLNVSKADAQKLIQSGLQNLEPVRRAVMAMEGTLGHDISPLLRKASAYSIVYQNTRLLAYAMFSNLIDPLGIIVRGGELKDAYVAFKRGMTSVVREWGDLTGLREAKEGDVDEATRIAEMIGTVDCAGFMSTMGNMYGSQFLPQWARNWNDNFFRWNGMEAFNKAMRVQATQAAIGFIKRHGGEKTNEHSERYLRELGLTAEDVSLGADGRLNVEDPKIQKAVMRWVDGAILRPNAAMRPTWMSDPHYAVFGHLKQFMYATHEVLLKRIVHEVKNGNSDPMITFIAGYVPVMLAADAAKGILQEVVGGGAPVWEHDSVGGIVAHGVERAGGLGVAQMGVDTVKYGPTSLLGPQVEQIMSAFSNPVSESLKEAVGVGPLSIMMKGAKMTNVVD